MAITLGASTTNFGIESGAPTVAVPSGASTGDRLYAWLTYSSVEAVTPPVGWTELAGGVMGSGYYSLVFRQMASGVTNATWAISAVVPATGVFAKYAAAMTVVKGGSGTTLGAVTVRGATSTTTVLPGVTVPAGGVLLAFAGEKSTSQTAVTTPAGMTQEASYVNGGGGGASVLIASQFPAAGASGTRTVTYAVGSGSGAGIMLTVPPATGTLPVVNAGTNSTGTTGVAKTLAGSSTGTSSVWTQVSGPSVTISNATSASTASFTPTVAGTYIFRLTGTNADGSVSDDVTITVAGTTSRPSGVVSNPGGFAPVNAASLEAALADASDSTYIEADATTGDAITVQLAPLVLGSSYTFTVRARSSIAPVHTVAFALMQGATVVATRTQQLTTAWATYTVTLTSGEAAAITNGSDLRVRATAA